MRVFWDTNLFVYLLEENPAFVDRVQQLFEDHAQNQDELCTSHLALGEIMAGPRRRGDELRAQEFCDTILASNVRILPFNMPATILFSQIRGAYKVSSPDAIHLACAAAEGVDLFLTNDGNLKKLVIPGIGRITSLDTDLF